MNGQQQNHVEQNEQQQSTIQNGAKSELSNHPLVSNLKLAIQNAWRVPALKRITKTVD